MVAMQLKVHRRDGRLLVVPGALSEVGFQGLDELIEDSDLVRALERAERRARAATALPMEQRFEPGTPPWQQAGCASYQDFVRGATLVSIVRDEELTEPFYLALSPDGSGFDGQDAPEELGPGTPLSVVAERVLAMFARPHSRVNDPI